MRLLRLAWAGALAGILAVTPPLHATPPASGACAGEGPCLPDDPPGLERSGDGRFARGSAGPTGQGHGKVIEVTNASGDDRSGSLRWAYAQIDRPSKVVLTEALDGQKIVLRDPIKWTKPYTTLDCSRTDARITVPCARPNCQGIVIGAVHDVVFYSCGAEGLFNEATPQLPGNNMSIFSIGNLVPVKWKWDDEWDATPHALRFTARDVLIDRPTTTRCQDDCLAVYDGAEDVSILRWFQRRGWHPMTAGSGGFRPAGDPKERRRISWAYGVAFMNGARTIRARLGIRDWSFVRNIVANWWEWVSPKGAISPNGGLWLEDDAGGENDLAYVVGNLGIPGAHNRDAGCFVGSKPGCDAGGFRAASNYAACNPKMVGTRWWFDRNDWGGSTECVPNPAGYTPLPRPSPGPGEPPVPPAPKFDELRPWAQLLAEAGPVKRRPDEQADLDWIAARLPPSPLRSQP